MELTTRCPECGASFGVSPEQLQLRKGFIRCIHCAHIFDGYEAVVPSSAPRFATADPSANGSADAGAAASGGWADAQATGPRSASVAPVFTVGQPASPSGTSGLIRRRPARTLPPASFEAQPLHEGFSALSQSATESDPEGVYLEPRHPDDVFIPGFLDHSAASGGRFARTVWAFLCIVGLLVAATQLVYIYRVQIAAELPFLRPYLELACKKANCRVGYPRDVNALSVFETSLKAPGGDYAQAQNKMVLGFALRNSGKKALEWPVLALDLIDFSGVAIIRLFLEPGQYLSGVPAGQPFEAQTEVRVSLPFSVQDVTIGGYQISPYYP